MPTITPVRSVESTEVSNLGTGFAHKYLFETLGDDDDGTPIKVNGLVVDMVVQVTGTWGGSTFNLRGSNDGTNWFNLPSFQGGALAMTTDGLEAPALIPLYIKPVTSGGAATDLDAILIIRTDG